MVSKNSAVVHRYQQGSEAVGNINASLLRHFINSHILLAECSPDAQYLWKALKRSGVIQTSIPDEWRVWNYDVRVGVHEPLVELGDPEVLTLGCGTTPFNTYENDELTSFGEKLGGAVFHCVTCGESHIGELSVKRLPSEEERRLLNRRYDGFSHATVVGDIFDPYFWKALVGKEFSLIKDHSRTSAEAMSEDQLRTFADNIHQHLKSPRIIEILDMKEGERLNPLVAKFIEKGYELLDSSSGTDSAYKFRLKK